MLYNIHAICKYAKILHNYLQKIVDFKGEVQWLMPVTLAIWAGGKGEDRDRSI
jgi:hypothetical protein